jgi:hypothetical protein
MSQNSIYEGQAKDEGIEIIQYHSMILSGGAMLRSVETVIPAIGFKKKYIYFIRIFVK